MTTNTRKETEIGWSDTARTVPSGGVGVVGWCGERGAGGGGEGGGEGVWGANEL